MPKTKISEFSATPANNTDIDSINIAEGCAPSGINDAIRELMAQLKDFQVGSAGDPVTVGGVLTVTAGAVGTPAITTAGDTNTGIFFPAADTIAFAEGGAEAMRIDASGRLIVGATSAAEGSPVEIVSNTSGGSIRIRGRASDGSGAVTFGTNATSTEYARVASDSSSALLFGTGSSGTERARIDSSGNLGLGVTPSAWATLVPVLQLGTGSSFIAGRTGLPELYLGTNAHYNGSGWIYKNTNVALLYAQDTNQHKWYHAASGTAGNTITYTQLMTLDNNGRLLLGTTSNIDNETGLGVVNSTSAQHVVIFRNGRNTSGDACLKLFVGSNCQNTSSYLLTGAVFGTANVIYIYGNGNVQNTNNSYGGISDVKLKENIVDATPKLDDLLKVKVRSYNFINDESKTKQLGVVAQELETIFPSMIEETPDKDAEGNELETTTKGVKYSVFVPMLIKAIQEQHALITQLQADVAALKA